MVLHKRDKSNKRPLIDADGFRWWLEEDPDHWSRSLEATMKELEDTGR